ncbi:MAG: SGNH/GDSL hydrolase family protein [Verrucomicrobia subdivision 3 bacterium]|nr:SGNH/GDSL hydrolase family protein [Limisphaerales bacterium]
MIAVELAVRVFFKENMSGRFEYGFHPSAGFVESDGQVNLKRTGGRRFRPQSFAIEPSEGVFRIFVVGDSVTRGSSVESSYAGQIAVNLKGQGISAESINLGIGGHGARRKHLTLAHSLKYKPDLIILHINNSNEFEDEREFLRSTEFDSWHPRNWPMKSRALRRLYEMKTEKVLWKWIPASIRMKHAKNDADAEIVAMSAAGALERWNQLVTKITGESTQAAASKQIPILLITQAYKMEDVNKARRLEDNGLEKIAESHVRRGVLHLSMKQVFGSLNFEPLYSDRSHLRAEGHEALSKAIVKKLIEAGIITPEN